MIAKYKGLHEGKQKMEKNKIILVIKLLYPNTLQSKYSQAR